MRLVKVETTIGTSVWVNREMVQAIGPNGDLIGQSVITFEKIQIVVKGSPDTIAKTLRDAT